MKTLSIFLALVLSAQMAQAACMRDLKGVEQNERSNPSCKAKFIKDIWSKYGNKTLQGSGMASSYRIKFLDPANGFKLVYNGQNMTGTICCVDGVWQMQNSEGVQSLQLSRSGVLISGYNFTPVRTGNISSSGNENGGSLGWDAGFSTGTRSSPARR